MKTVKVLVGKGGHAGITCPNCEKNHLVPVGKFKGARHTLVTKCSCQERFKVELNFREFHRKEVKLAGKFLNVSTRSNKWQTMTVFDLSLNGLGFQALGSTDIEKGHSLRVQFTLDNNRVTEIEREVEVVSVRKNKYGCLFQNLDYEKELGFYLGTWRVIS